MQTHWWRTYNINLPGCASQLPSMGLPSSQYLTFSKTTIDYCREVVFVIASSPGFISFTATLLREIFPILDWAVPRSSIHMDMHFIERRNCEIRNDFKRFEEDIFPIRLGTTRGCSGFLSDPLGSFPGLGTPSQPVFQRFLFMTVTVFCYGPPRPHP